jgi:hypothetical protein
MHSFIAQHDAPSLWEYRHYNVIVRTVADTQPLIVLDAYWTPKTPANIAHCVTMPERRLLLGKAQATCRNKRGQGVLVPKYHRLGMNALS